MQTHNQEYSAEHVQLLSQKMREADQQKEERHLPLTVTMTNYQQLLSGRERWCSRLLYTQERGYAIFLAVYVGGYGIGFLAGDISVYVYITRGEYDEELQWPYRLTIKVSLLNQDDNEDKVTKTFNIQAKKNDQNCYEGWQRFIKESIAKGYVKNNCLKFMVSNITEHSV
jgi:hypothetical protein